MEITWFGHSCFLLRSGDTRLVINPFDKSSGYPPFKIRQSVNIVVLSHQHPGHSYVNAEKDKSKVIDGPGEYEINGVLIEGINMFHDQEQDNVRRENTVYTIEMDGLILCHLGDLGHSLSSQQAEQLSHVEILLLPVGGVSTINAETAAKIVRMLEPAIVIPMHFQTEITPDLEPIERFLKEIGVKECIPQSKLSVTKSKLPAETRVILLERRS